MKKKQKKWKYIIIAVIVIVLAVILGMIAGRMLADTFL